MGCGEGPTAADGCSVFFDTSPRTRSTKFAEVDDPRFGYDVRKDAFYDLIEHGVIDPVKVVRVALQNAASIAGLMITTEAVIALDSNEAPATGSGGHRHPL
jgi:chaperonin GroEL (HSP60 family)